MKKNWIFSLLLTLFLVFPFTSVKALTKVNFKEASNGQIDTTIHFEEGFVGGIDLVFKVSDSVSVKKFEFNSDYTKNNYTTNYSYNASNHELKLRVTTGGIGSEHNLLNSKKELSLGKIILTSSAKQNVEYTISNPTLMYLNNNWKKETIENGHLTLGDNKFTYKVTSTDNTKPDDDKEESNKPGNNNESTSGGNQTGSGGTSSNNNSNNNSTTNSVISGGVVQGGTPNSGNTTDKTDKNETDKETQNDKEDDNENILESEDDIDSDIENDNDNDMEDINENNEETKKNKISTPLLIVIAVVAVLLIIGFVVLFELRGSKDDIPF